MTFTSLPVFLLSPFRLSFLFFGATFLLGCHVEPDPCELPGHTFHLTHNEEVKVTGRGGLITLPMDLDGDGNNDLEFKLDAWSLMGGGGWSNASINCINKAFSISTFVTQDTSWQSDAFTNADGSYWSRKVAVEITRTFSCRRLSETDSILNTRETVRIKNYDYCGKVNQDGDWTTDEVFLYRYNYTNSFGLHEVTRNTDTIWLIGYKDIQDCHPLPTDTTYIGIRKTGKNTYKSGWIKISVKDGIIKVLESVIQK